MVSANRLFPGAYRVHRAVTQGLIRGSEDTKDNQENLVSLRALLRVFETNFRGYNAILILFWVAEDI